MKPFAAPVLALLLGLGGSAPPATDDPAAILASAPTCHGAPAPTTTTAPTTAPGLVAGFGDAGFAAEGAKPDAALYLEQGARLAWDFNAPEAVRAFAWAQRLDPACALCVWGEAWARGSTINYGIDAAEVARARGLAVHAAALAPRQTLSPTARGLIAALLVRYPAGRPRVDDGAYADAMDALARRLPADDAVAVEAASALLIASGSAWRDLGARPTPPRVARARALLETVLARSPRFTPAIHFYIHLMEWMDEPTKAVAYADALGALAPAAGHLVHMPSHLYYRLGRYADAARSNARASAADADYVRALHPPGGLADFSLYAHNLSFGLAGALMDGDGPSALAFAHALRTTFSDPKGVAARGWFADARYAPVETVLAANAPAEPYSQALWRYARGEALARAGRGREIDAEARAIAALQPKAGGDEVKLARWMLEARAQVLQGRPATALDPLRRAAKLRDGPNQGRDPPVWPFPPRRSLGAALLLSGDARGAERELAASLKTEPRDGLALYALSLAQRRLGDRAADATLAQARREWKGDPSAFRLETI